MIKRFKLLAITMTMALLLPIKANAAPVITDESLYELTDMIQKEVSWYKTFGKVVGYELNLGREVEVSNNDTFYRVTLPNASIYVRDLDKNINIGDIVANMIQTGNNVWKARVSIPNQIIITDKDENIDTTITLGSQRFSFVWVPEYKIYPEFRANIQDLQIESEYNDAISLHARELKFKSGLNPNRTKDWAGVNKVKSWGGKSLLEIFDIKSVINKEFSVKIDEIRNQRGHEQFYPMGIVKNRILLDKFIKTREDENDEEGITLLDTYNAFSSLLAHSQSSKNNLEVRGLDVLTTKDYGGDSIILDRLQISSKTTGIEDGLFNTLNRIEFNDLSTTDGFTGEFTPLVPKNGVIPMSLRNTSARTLKKVILDEVLALTNKNDEILLSRLMNKMKPLFEDDNSYMSISDMHLRDGASDMRGSMNARINPHAIYGFTAKAQLLFDGYDYLDTNLKVISGEPHIDLGTLISAFTPNMYAESAIPENFVSVGNYTINILESGRIKVNDQGAVTRSLESQPFGSAWQVDKPRKKRQPSKWDKTWDNTKDLFSSLMPK